MDQLSFDHNFDFSLSGFKTLLDSYLDFFSVLGSKISYKSLLGYGIEFFPSSFFC